MTNTPPPELEPAFVDVRSWGEHKPSHAIYYYKIEPKWGNWSDYCYLAAIEMFVLLIIKCYLILASLNKGKTRKKNSHSALMSNVFLKPHFSKEDTKHVVNETWLRRKESRKHKNVLFPRDHSGSNSLFHIHAPYYRFQHTSIYGSIQVKCEGIVKKLHRMRVMRDTERYFFGLHCIWLCQSLSGAKTLHPRNILVLWTCCLLDRLINPK